MNTVLTLAMGLVTSSPLFAQELTEDTFGNLYSFILPKEKDLAWRKISWHRSLWEGVLEAQARDKPLLFWAMNGHPLDCV
jgi:hypothetical protein